MGRCCGRDARPNAAGNYLATRVARSALPPGTPAVHERKRTSATAAVTRRSSTVLASEPKLP
eukprot:6821358-Lingulodinium_polyedra.AAC.1